MLPFSLPDFGQLAVNLLQDVDLFIDGTLLKSLLESGLRLEFLSPYLRLFSFCDYTIPQP